MGFRDQLKLIIDSFTNLIYPISVCLVKKTSTEKKLDRFDNTGNRIHTVVYSMMHQLNNPIIRISIRVYW